MVKLEDSYSTTYADDVCLISLSAHAMQEMINICQKFANSHDLLFNSTKTMSMCFASKDMYRYKPDVKKNSLCKSDLYHRSLQVSWCYHS